MNWNKILKRQKLMDEIEKTENKNKKEEININKPDL